MVPSAIHEPACRGCGSRQEEKARDMAEIAGRKDAGKQRGLCSGPRLPFSPPGVPRHLPERFLAIDSSRRRLAVGGNMYQASEASASQSWLLTRCSCIRQWSGGPCSLRTSLARTGSGPLIGMNRSGGDRFGLPLRFAYFGRLP